MHELPILRDIVGVALRYAERAGATKVVSVDLQIGELRDLDDAWMQRYFDFVTEGTAAAGAVLRVTRSRLAFWCRPCSGTFRFDVHSAEVAECPTCRGRDVELVAGNELRIESIDVMQEERV